MLPGGNTIIFGLRAPGAAASRAISAAMVRQMNSSQNVVERA